jgi:hypothetical protein
MGRSSHSSAKLHPSVGVSIGNIATLLQFSVLQGGGLRELRLR